MTKHYSRSGLSYTGIMGGQGLFPALASGLALALALGAGPAIAIAGALTILAAQCSAKVLTGIS